jgi:hypothetical protein
MVDGQAGKGDRYRDVDRKKWDENYERIFGKKKSRQTKEKKDLNPK